jgi:hypothetical protein
MSDWRLVLLLIGVLALTMYRIASARKANMALFTPKVRAALELSKRADKLRKTDPAAADRLLADTAKAQARQEEQVREDLRRRAATDPEAAADLKSRLMEDLNNIATARQYIEKRLRDDPKRPNLLAKATEEAAKATRELEALESLVRGSQ